MSAIVEVAFKGKHADDTTRKMARLFAYDNSGFSVKEIALRLGETESNVWNSLLRLKNDMEIVENKMDHANPIQAGDKTRIENKFKVKDEYIREVKALVISQDGVS